MSSTNITISANVDRTVSDYQVREALAVLARDNGVTLNDLAVTVQPAEARVQVTMTESERAAYETWKASTNPSA